MSNEFVMWISIHFLTTSHRPSKTGFAMPNASITLHTKKGKNWVLPQVSLYAIGILKAAQRIQDMFQSWSRILTGWRQGQGWTEHQWRESRGRKRRCGGRWWQTGGRRRWAGCRRCCWRGRRPCRVWGWQHHRRRSWPWRPQAGSWWRHLKGERGE